MIDYTIKPLKEEENKEERKETQNMEMMQEILKSNEYIQRYQYLNQKNYLDVKEVKEFLNIGQSTAYKMVQKFGKKVGNKYVIKRSDIDTAISKLNTEKYKY